MGTLPFIPYDIRKYIAFIDLEKDLQVNWVPTDTLVKDIKSYCQILDLIFYFKYKLFNLTNRTIQLIFFSLSIF